MKRPLIIFIAIVVVALVLGVAAYLVLPDQVRMQVNSSGNGTVLPKLVAVLIPFAVMVIFGFLYFKDPKNPKSLVVAGVGLLCYILTFIFNL